MLVNPSALCVGVALVKLDALKVEVLLDNGARDVFEVLSPPVLNAIPVMDERTGAFNAWSTPIVA